MEFNELEIKRKLFHMVSGIIIVLLLDLNIFNKIVLAIILTLGAITSLVSRKIKIPIIYWFLKNMDRRLDLEKYPGKGALTFLLGCLLTLILFEKDIALASILILSIGDAVGAFVGIHFGKTKNPLNRKKLLEGTLAGIFAAFIAASIFVPYIQALIASSISMLVEAIEIKLNKNLILDDNITMPLVSGLSIYLFRLIF